MEDNRFPRQNLWLVAETPLTFHNPFYQLQRIAPTPLVGMAPHISLLRKFSWRNSLERLIDLISWMADYRPAFDIEIGPLDTFNNRGKIHPFLTVEDDGALAEFHRRFLAEGGRWLSDIRHSNFTPHIMVHRHVDQSIVWKMGAAARQLMPKTVHINRLELMRLIGGQWTPVQGFDLEEPEETAEVIKLPIVTKVRQLI